MSHRVSICAHTRCQRSHSWLPFSWKRSRSMLRSCLSLNSCSPTSFAFATSSSSLENTEPLSFTSPSHCCKRRQHRVSVTGSRRDQGRDVLPASWEGVNGFIFPPLLKLQRTGRCRMKGNMLPGQIGAGHVPQQQTEHKPQHLLYTHKAIRALRSAALNPLKIYQGKKNVPQSKKSRKKCPTVHSAEKRRGHSS